MENSREVKIYRCPPRFEIYTKNYYGSDLFQIPRPTPEKDLQ
jgi:hypothetical protein